jgi:hypothetical protein
VDFSVDGVRREVRELLVKLRGEEGKEVRKNADALGAAMEKSWTEGGEAISQTNAFLAKYVRSSWDIKSCHPLKSMGYNT